MAKSKLTFILSLLLYLTIEQQMAAAGTIAPSASASRNIFAADIFNTVASTRSQENVIFSPASIQSCVTLAFFGAKGQTAEEMRNGLRLGAGSKSDIAQNYAVFLKHAFKSQSAEGPQLRMANRIYINDGLQIQSEFNKIAAEHFDTQAETVQFSDAANAAQKINNWVEQQTENKITNLMQPNGLNADTSAVLVNAIYFKGKWEIPFSKSATHKSDFMLSAQHKTPVDMMYLSEKLRYASLADMDATALEMPYKNSDISMLILLPNKIDGLARLEQSLAKADLAEIASRLNVEDVDVFLPKFKIEFELDLKQSLAKLGMPTMFSDKADFSNLFITSTPQKVSEVKHKAFIDVNEAGSEAAAATFMKIVPMSLNLNQKTFQADHPFVFAIRSSQAVYFAGHVAKF